MTVVPKDYRLELREMQKYTKPTLTDVKQYR